MITARFLWVSTLIWCPLLFGQDWPQWLGPQRNGLVVGFEEPAVWPKRLKKVWRREVGQGFASPVADPSGIYIFSGQGGREILTCLEPGDGTVKWTYDYAVSFTENPYALKFGKGPFATPLLKKGRLFSVGVTGAIHCLDAATGTLLWKREPTWDLTDKRHFFCGNTVSPLSLGRRNLFHIGHEAGGIMMALDHQTGSPAWRWSRDNAGYASPILVELDGKRQIVCLAQTLCVGIDPKTGNQLWQFPFQSDWRENIVSPVFWKGSIIIAGVDRAITALDIKREKGGWRVKTHWENKQISMYMSSPLVAEDRLYGLSKQEKGAFFCLDARSGEILWKSEGRKGEQAFFLLSGPHVLILTNTAQLWVLDPRKASFEPLAVFEVADSPTWTCPILFEDKILIKDKKSLTLWSIR